MSEDYMAKRWREECEAAREELSDAQALIDQLGESNRLFFETIQHERRSLRLVTVIAILGWLAFILGVTL